MLKHSRRFCYLLHLATMLLTRALDALRFLGLCVRPSPTLAAENLFLRKQLALCQERNVRPRRTTDGCHPNHHDLARPLVRLEAGFSGRPAQDLSAMISTSVSLVLEVEIKTGIFYPIISASLPIRF